jgi:HK97 family phage major capsid protein
MKKYPGNGLGFVNCRIERIAAVEEGAEPKYEIKISDNTELERSFFGMNFRERINHSPGSVNLSRLESGRAPFLYEHDPKDQIGVLEAPRLEGGALYANVRWASGGRAEEVRRMVDEDIRPNISVGMVQKRVKLVEENTKKGDLWEVLSWEPMEASSVAVGSNPHAAFTGYEPGKESGLHVEVVEDDPPVTIQGGDKAMKHVRTESGGVIEVADDDARQELSLVEMANHRNAEISGLCHRYGQSARAEEYQRSGMTPDAVASDILRRLTPGAPPVRGNGDQPDPLKNVPAKDRHSYSYVKAILEAADGGKLTGIERDMDSELRGQQKQLGMYAKVQHGAGIMLPLDLRTDEERMARYALNSVVATKGVETVFDRPGEVIELLRNQTAVVRLGARLLTGLTSPIAFPKQTGAMTATWVGENPGSAVSASDLALGLVTLTPRWLQATTSISRQLLIQASIDVEGMVRNDIARIHAIAIDRAAIHGQAGGAGAEPKGVYVWPDVQQKAMGGAIDFTELTAMIGLVAAKNALDGSPGWLTTPGLAAKWLATLDFSAAAAGRAIWQGRIDTKGPGGQVAGYTAFSTNQVSSTMTGTAGAVVGGSDQGLIFGNWDDMIIGMFGAQEIIVDPYTLADKGLLKLTSFQGADIIIRHGESFCVGTGGTVA